MMKLSVMCHVFRTRQLHLLLCISVKSAATTYANIPLTLLHTGTRTINFHAPNNPYLLKTKKAKQRRRLLQTDFTPVLPTAGPKYRDISWDFGNL